MIGDMFLGIMSMDLRMTFELLTLDRRNKQYVETVSNGH